MESFNLREIVNALKQDPAFCRFQFPEVIVFVVVDLAEKILDLELGCLLDLLQGILIDSLCVESVVA